MRKRSTHCEYCYHHEDFHEFARDRRTPRQTAARKFECTDCILCEKEHIDD